MRGRRIHGGQHVRPGDLRRRCLFFRSGGAYAGRGCNRSADPPMGDGAAQGQGDALYRREDRSAGSIAYRHGQPRGARRRTGPSRPGACAAHRAGAAVRPEAVEAFAEPRGRCARLSHVAGGAFRHAPAVAPDRRISRRARARPGAGDPAQQIGRLGMTHRLEPLLNPASIALIGASDNAGRIGGLPLDLLTRFGYAGHVYPVNPKYQEVFGLRCWPDIESVPQSVDLAVLAIGAGDVTPMLRRCHARGVRAASVYAAGFAEAGEEGTRLQRELEEFSAASGMLVAGPNCMGFANLNTQAHTAFASVFKTAPMQQEPGLVSLLTQSGNVCAAVYALARRQGLPFSQFINTGNEACIDFSEYLEYLARDEHTEIVLGYIEQLRD